MKRINVGFIGCGRISDVHAPGYEDNDKATLYAVCDKAGEVSERRKAEWGAVKSYTDYRELLADPEIDAVEILSPQPLHEQMVIDAARAGKHIALQKPMANDLRSADRMLEAVEAAGVVFKVTDNYVFYPPIIKARQMLEAGEIGEPTNLRTKLIAGGEGGWEVPAAAWEWRMKENSEGRGMQTFDHGHHLWATAWYLLGDVERVVAWIDSLDGIVDSPATVMWKYNSGVKYGMCEYALAADLHIPSNYYANDEWMEVTGSKGILVIHRCTGNIIEGPALSRFDGHRWHHYELPSDWGEGFIGATHNFIDAIRGEARPRLTGQEAREVLKFSLAIQRSARKRREVYLDELDRPLASLRAWSRFGSLRLKNSDLAKRLKSLSFGGKDSKYAPQAESLTLEMAAQLDPTAAGDWSLILGLLLLEDGDTPESGFAIRLEQGKLQVEKGPIPEDAELVLKVPAGTWAAILLEKKKIETAFLQGKLKLEGKAELALKLRHALGM